MNREPINIDKYVPKAADRIQEGNIRYIIKWYGNEASVQILDDSTEANLVVAAVAAANLRDLQREMKENKQVRMNLGNDTVGVAKGVFFLKKMADYFIDILFQRYNESLKDDTQPTTDTEGLQPDRSPDQTPA